MTDRPEREECSSAWSSVGVRAFSKGEWNVYPERECAGVVGGALAAAVEEKMLVSEKRGK